MFIVLATRAITMMMLWVNNFIVNERFFFQPKLGDVF